jgi:glycosyltransferase involved in cell wall biosynthesis
MHIAQVAPLAEPVPPKLYGGTERVVSWLTEELVARGHDVTLFASGDSTTGATLVPVIPRATRLGRPRPDVTAAAALLLNAVAEAAHEFDVIHFHIDWIHLPVMARLATPFLTTCHGRLDLPGSSELIRYFPTAPFVSISNNQRVSLPHANWLGTVYHGLPPDRYQPSFQQGQYLAFLGRITPEKGPEDAIKIARQAGLPLRIAAKLPRQQSRYFKEHLAPLIDGRQIQFTGELDEQGKGEFLRNAVALLFPIDWPEPFGLVMIEAMACGTPVIAYPCGSVPEVLDDGLTGFIVADEAEAAKAVGRVGKIDRRRVREIFEKRFTCSQMAGAYLDHYETLTNDAAQSFLAEKSPSKESPTSLVAVTDPRGQRLLPRFKKRSDRPANTHLKRPG